MAKSEVGSQSGDMGDILDRRMSDIGEVQDLPTGRWSLKYIKGGTFSGNGEKSAWTKVVLTFEPIAPVEVNEDELAEFDMDDMPRVEFSKFVSNTSDQRTLRDILVAFGADPEAKLRDGLEQAKGGEATAYIRPNGEYRGKTQYFFANFKPAE